jgi:hypothetical protein
MKRVAEDVGTARRSVRTFNQSIPAPADDVFDLLCPVHESAWLDGWDYRMVYSESGYAEPGCVFTTNDGGRATVWVVTHHDPVAREIRFVRCTEGLAATTLEVRAEPISSRQTTVHIRYAHTSLGTEGDAFLDTITEAAFNERMRFWEASMTYYLQNGEKLSQQAYAGSNPDRPE